MVPSEALARSQTTAGSIQNFVCVTGVINVPECKNAKGKGGKKKIRSNLCNLVFWIGILNSTKLTRICLLPSVKRHKHTQTRHRTCDTHDTHTRRHTTHDKHRQHTKVWTPNCFSHFELPLSDTIKASTHMHTIRQRTSHTQTHTHDAHTHTKHSHKCHTRGTAHVRAHMTSEIKDENFVVSDRSQHGQW